MNNIYKIKLCNVDDVWDSISEEIIRELDHGIDGLTIEDTKMKYMFFDYYNLYERSLQELNRRVNFYFHLLKTKNKNYIELIGSEDFEFRVVLAIHNCWNKKEKLIINAENFCHQFVVDAVIGVYDRYNNDDRSDCEKMGVCICGDAKRPYIHSCLPNDNTIIQVK